MVKGTRTRNQSNHEAAELRLRPHGHRDRPVTHLVGQTYEVEHTETSHSQEEFEVRPERSLGPSLERLTLF
jgi:hypothetical protein